MASAVFNLSDLDGTNGFVINGNGTYNYSGYSVSNAGDVNGDGIDDLIIGAPGSANLYASPGGSYVVFGSSTGFDPSFDLSSLDGTNGFVIPNRYDSDISVSSAGDVNGDGISDLIIGKGGGFYYTAYDSGYGTDIIRVDYAGKSYVIFGSSSGFDRRLGESNLDGTNGFVLNVTDVGDFSGISVSNAGDVNGDGIDDFIIGKGSGASGESYVVFGSSSGFDPSFDLSSLDGTNGFVINSSGSISNAGDVNGDGIDDLTIGPYVVFGSSSGFDPSFELSSLDGTNGFVINLNGSVRNGGDINGDGFDDFIIGASGESYVVFGSSSGFDPSFELSSLDGTNGFVINSSGSVNAGDVNGDGIDDLIIGAPNASPNGNSRAGESYVVFGSSSSFGASLELSSLDGTNGFVINGIDRGDYSGRSVSSAGDVNGDGIDDLIIGAPGASPNGNFLAGESYVVFGRASTQVPTINGKLATIYVDADGNLVGNALGAGEPYIGELFSNTDGTANPDDVIAGTNGDDNIWAGNEGNDTIDSGAGNDTVGFGDGDAWVKAGADDDFVYAAGNGGGHNTIDLGAGNDGFWAAAGNNNVTSASGNNTIGIGTGNDTVTTGDGDDLVYTVEGGGGTNTLDLGHGNNTVWVEAGDYDIFTGSGDDSIGLGIGTDTVDAGDGNNIIYMVNPNGTTDGNKDIVTGLGNDWVQTGSGDDRLDLGTHTAGRGNFDMAFGQGGSDTFVLNQGSGFLVVGDFTQGEDLLEISGLSFGELNITTNNHRTLISTNGGDLLAQLQNFNTMLTASDFTVV